MEFYITDLYSKIEQHKIDVLKQKGCSDIEPCDYGEKIEVWYDQIKEIIIINPPVDYVKALYVVQDSNEIIKEVKYLYYDNDDSMEHFYINLFWD